MKKKYVFAKLSNFDSFGLRIGGAGLGNILFPWARAVVYAKKNNLQLINTTWKTLKLGPLLRGELDTRGYSNLFEENNIKGLKKFSLLNFKKNYYEKDVNQFTDEKKESVLTFTGMKNQMHDILDDYEIVKNELINITRNEHLENIKKFDGKGITVHIRMGDFAVPNSEDEIRNGKTNCKLPLKWYISIIKKIRVEFNKDIPVNIFSDGTDEELKEILTLENTSRHYYGSAIADMLAISNSELLIASNSTFSLWSSYLGRMPTIWFPGTHRVKLFKNETIVENEMDYNDSIKEKNLGLENVFKL